MTTPARAILIVHVLSFTCGSPAHAQDDATRHGFWFGVGLGYGSASFACDTCISGSRFGGLNVSLALGGTPNPHLRLGVGLDAWGYRLGGDSLKENTTATASLWYYPRLRGGPFVEGGVGLSDYRVQKVKRVFLGNAFADSTYVAGTGGGVTFGVGWEVPQGEFRVAYAYGYVGALHAPGGTTVAKRWKQNLLLVQVEFRSGR